MNEHTDNLSIELSFRGLEAFLVLGWTDKIKARKKHEQQGNQRETRGSLQSPGHPLQYQKCNKIDCETATKEIVSCCNGVVRAK
jgi:hypothetical protein